MKDNTLYLLHLNVDFYDCKTIFTGTKDYQASTSKNPFKIDE
ncbi:MULTISPECIES: hypothetical protein [unclassified Methanobrevibacter]